MAARVTGPLANSAANSPLTTAPRGLPPSRRPTPALTSVHRFAIEVELVAVAAADVLAALHPHPVEMTRFQRRELEGATHQQDLLVPQRAHRIGVAAVGVGARLRVGHQFAVELAEGRLALLPTGLGGIEVGCEPVLHALRIGDRAVAPRRDVVSLFLRRIEGVVIPGRILEVGAEDVPVVIVDADLAIERDETVQRTTRAVGRLGGIGFGEQLRAVPADVFVNQLVADDRDDRLFQLGAEFLGIGGEKDAGIRQRLFRESLPGELVEQIIAARYVGQRAGQEFEMLVIDARDVLAASPQSSRRHSPRRPRRAFPRPVPARPRWPLRAAWGGPSSARRSC